MNDYMGIKDIKFKKYGLKTTAMKSVFWPCYRLAVSVESRDEIDPFAKVVLQMANCGITDTDELAEELCLNPDFVKLLQARLVHKNFLNSNYQITEETKSIMNQSDNGLPKSNTNKQIGYIFIDALTGNILPYSTKDSAIDSIVSCDQQNGIVSFIEKDNNFIKGQIVGHSENFIFRAPSPRECLKACRKGDFHQVGSVELISKEKTNAELVLLHLYAFIQYGQTKVFVSGLNSSISDNFTEYVAENSSKMEWVSRLRDQSKSSLEDEDRKEKIENRYLYKDISKKIESNNQLWEIIKKESKYIEENDIKEEQQNLTTVASNLYDIIELGLAENFKKHPSSDAENILLLCEQESINDYIKGLAERIGIDTEGVESILTYKKGSVAGICDGDENSAQMESLLALHIASATIKSEHFLFDKDFDKNALFKDIVFLKLYRNIDKHGKQKSEQVVIDKNMLQEVMERTYLLLLRLIPNIGQDFKILNKQDYSNRRDIHTLRMDALEQLENVFGSSFLVHLEKENYKLYDELQSTERAFLEKTGKELDRIYSLLQNVFFDSSKKLSDGKTLYGNLLELVKSKEPRLPESITTVKEDFLNKAIKGEFANSMGAAIAAFIVQCPIEDYKIFFHSNPQWLEFCNIILCKRGHSSKSVDLGIERDSFRQKTYKIVKELFSMVY